MTKSKQDMTAIVKTALGPDSISVMAWPRPVPKSGQVIVEVHGAGVCGTDLHIANDAYPTIPPVVMGHEVAGTVVEVGADVDVKWIGVRVACETHHQICRCDFCRDGRRNLCKNKTSMGSFVDGGFAAYVAVAEELLHPIPNGVTDHEAALTEPLACVCHLLLDPALINVADKVLVTGPGPMGLLAAQVARAAGGIVTISGLEKDKLRLDVARNLGFMITHSPEPESFDVVIECSGSEGGIGVALKESITEPGNWSMGWGSWGEHLPYYENKVSLNKDKKDKWGLPTLDIDCEFKDNEMKMRVDMKNSAAEMLEAAGIKNITTYDNMPAPGFCIH
jgi:L-iditol 2-dehydrogenase